MGSTRHSDAGKGVAFFACLLWLCQMINLWQFGIGLAAAAVLLLIPLLSSRSSRRPHSNTCTGCGRSARILWEGRCRSCER